MLTMRGAAALLGAARTTAGMWDLLCATGLCSPPVAVDAQTRASLGLDGSDCSGIASGTGLLRSLIVQLDGSSPLRESVQRIARRLSSATPHVLWLLGVVDRGGESVALSVWSHGARSVKIASFVWEPGAVVDSDAETLCALAAVREDTDFAVHSRCLEVLGRESLTRRFYRLLAANVDAMTQAVPRRVSREDARSLALLCVSRLLFLRFLEAKGWLNGEREFVSARFDECMSRGGRFHERILLPLFFGTLNTPMPRRAARARAFGRVPFLNGGLFTRTPLERRERVLHDDERFGALLQDVFHRFRFVAREDTASWSEASVDPEMLGRAFESLMAVNDRRSGGVFYTPHELVSRVTGHALDSVFAAQNLKQVRDIRVLDPACGSGAFLVHVLERIADQRRRLGDPGSVSEVRRDVLSRSVFGVDRNPTAVWLCELRLWLSVVIESTETDPLRVTPLPNLDRNIRVGDALTGTAFDGKWVGSAGRVAALRRSYVRATGRRKAVLALTLDRLERQRALEHVERLVASATHARRELLSAHRSPDLFGERPGIGLDIRRTLEQLRASLRQYKRERVSILDGGALPFSFDALFAEAQAAGGFDVVLGNPPWVRLHRIPLETRQRFRATFEVFRAAHWQAGARSARAAAGFASQVDLSALFVERSLALLKPHGVLSLLLPAKLWRSLSGGGVRRLLASKASMLCLEDISGGKHLFDAVVYPSLLVARAETRTTSVAIVVHQSRAERSWTTTPGRMAFDATPGAPWVLLPPDARDAFERLRAGGKALAETAFGAPRLGVKSGCNAAFLVKRVDEVRGFSAVIDAAGESGCIEATMLRPALRGDSLRAWRQAESPLHIVWTHDASGAPLAKLPPRALAWLERHHTSLWHRTDAKGSKRWWTLFRTESGHCARARLVWADFGRRPRALVLAQADPTVPLNTCYSLACDDACDAWALAALLNSRIAAAWLNAIAEPARGGYRRYLGWTVGQLPIPHDWAAVRESLARVARSAAEGRGAAMLDQAVSAAYGVSLRDLGPLLEFEPCE